MIRVHEDPEEHVDDVNEYVGAEQPLPEIPGMPHLGEEGDEEDRAAIGVHGLVKTVQGAGETGAAAGEAGGWSAGEGANGTGAEGGAERGGCGDEVWRGVCGDAHACVVSGVGLLVMV